MKKTLLMIVAATGTFFTANWANAQETVVVEEESFAIGEVDCQDHYYSTNRDNWFIQLGAGIQSPFVENEMPDGKPHHQITAAYNAGFGKWMSPYIGWRISGYYGAMHWENGAFEKAKMANANFDIMWDMFNSFGNVNSKRVFSIVPFVGLGGTFTWDYKAPNTNVYRDNGKKKINSWTLPVSAGLQLRFRVCDYMDIFFEGRASFYGDNFNNEVVGAPVDMNITAIGGININIGGSNFKSYNPCNELAYIGGLNSQINAMRGELAATATALAVAESQLPCPEVKETVVEQVVEAAPMMSTVRFTINSAKISPEEMVNVYNVAEYMKANPEVAVTIVGYADKDTGTAAYNQKLSERRAQAVYDALTKTYGIDASRLSMQAEGSATQPYNVNNWNRIVIFAPGI